MRIALVSQEYPPETAKGGIGSQTFLKAHGLAALGHDVQVVSRSTTREKAVRDDGAVKVTRIPGMDARTGVYTTIADWLTYSAEVAVAIADLHKGAPLDIIDFPEWGAEGYLHLLNRTEWNFVPTVIHLHGPLVMFAHTLGWPEINSDFFRIGSAMEGTMLRLADAIFSSSRCSAEWCARHYGLNADRIPVLHTGVDTKLFAPRDQPKAKRPTIVFAGKLARNKGVHSLTEAACQLAREFPDLRLQLFGRGEPNIIEELRSHTTECGLADLIELPGFVDRTALPDYLSRAHVFAAPSQYEGGPGFVYLEAMACGLPVIACVGSGAAEVIADGKTGVLVPPNDVAALADALRTLLADSARRQTIGDEARRYVVAEADSKACLVRLEAFYASVIAGRRELPKAGAVS